MGCSNPKETHWKKYLAGAYSGYQTTLQAGTEKFW